ncbi:Bacterial ubiquitin-like modifier [Mobiluncus curtisii subsp. curtisii]|nr:Bacterial ubiquitin-like modifier [Mobiluncus curtisii subsp. curtisii]
MKQDQTNYPATPTSPDSSAFPVGHGQIQEPAGLDDLLDEIEDLVAEDAGTFVQGFVQKGGE